MSTRRPSSRRIPIDVGLTSDIKQDWEDTSRDREPFSAKAGGCRLVGLEDCNYILALHQLKVLAFNHNSLLFFDQLF